MSKIDRIRPPRFETDSIPQSMQFMIDCLPAIRKLLQNWSSDKILKVCDVGTGSGSGANLLATLHKGNFFGRRWK